MRVEQLMTRNVRTCSPDESLSAAARIMWESDCGCVPVVAGARVVGMLTDRDVCMAAYTQGQPLRDIPVATAMARAVRSCRTRDSVSTALRIMTTGQVHRLPVLDEDDSLVGIVSMADIAREAAREHAAPKREVTDVQVAETIEAISQPRGPHAVQRAA
jgi:CBS domain-containing protein